MTDEGIAGRSLKGKMLSHAKHMTTVKDRLFQIGVGKGGDKQITQPGPKHQKIANWTATAHTQKWYKTRDRITWSLFLQSWLTPTTTIKETPSLLKKNYFPLFIWQML